MGAISDLLWSDQLSDVVILRLNLFCQFIASAREFEVMGISSAVLVYRGKKLLVQFRRLWPSEDSGLEMVKSIEHNTVCIQRQHLLADLTISYIWSRLREVE